MPRLTPIEKAVLASDKRIERMEARREKAAEKAAAKARAYWDAKIEVEETQNAALRAASAQTTT